MSVTLTNHGLNVDGQIVPVYSGSVHYWRLERALWPKILDRVIELGFGMVETYIPWSVHETSPGVFDWGRIDDRKDVEAFMRLCEEKGLWLMVRPGPLINAELTDFGFPEWVLLDPDVQARTASGSLHIDAAWGLHPPRPYPTPSYASEAFYTAVGGWFDAICPIMARHLAPAGCIVACQSDNETCYFFHDQPYATDYSESSLDLYWRYLSKQYGTIETLNAAYGTSYRVFLEVEPPRDCGVTGAGDLPLHLDWVAYKELQIRGSVSRISGMLKTRGIVGIPIFHDVAFQETTPHDVARLEADPEIDWVGMNMYCNKEQYHTVARRSRFLAGTTILPFVPEFGCGLWSHHPRTFTPDEHEFVTLSAYMNGVKAVNFYMLVERERWQGCPITRHGELRSDYAPFYRQLNAFLRKFPLWEFERQRDTLLLSNYDLTRHNATMSTLHLAHADLLGLPEELFAVDVDLGLSADPRIEEDVSSPDSWLGQAGRELATRGIEFDLADTHIDPARLDRYELICVQSLDFMDPDDQVRLLGYVEDGGRLVIGPEMPALDPLLRPATVLASTLDAPGRVQIGQGELIWAKARDLAATFDELAPAAELKLESGVLQLSVHRRGEQTLLFTANPTAAAATDWLTFDGCRTFRPVWGGGEFQHADGELSVTHPAYSVRIWDAGLTRGAKGERE